MTSAASVAALPERERQRETERESERNRMVIPVSKVTGKVTLPQLLNLSIGLIQGCCFPWLCDSYQEKFPILKSNEEVRPPLQLLSFSSFLVSLSKGTTWQFYILAT